MTEEQRAPWVYLAEAEKKRHATLYPGYKYTPRRNRKFKPTEEEVEKQIEKEAEKVVEAEARRIAEENTKDLVTVYYPPWATRRTLTYFARRATSCPPEGAISVEPYSETLDRAMVTTSMKASPKEDVEKEECLDKEEQSPSETVENVFVPSAYGIYDEDISCSSQSPPSWSIRPDQSLSQWSYTINPPGGTTSWGEEPPSPSEYPPPSASTQYAFHVRPVPSGLAFAHRTQEQAEQLCVPSFFYTQQGEFAMSVGIVQYVEYRLGSAHVFDSLMPVYHLVDSGISPTMRIVGRRNYLLCNHHRRMTRPRLHHRLLRRSTPCSLAQGRFKAWKTPMLRPAERSTFSPSMGMFSSQSGLRSRQYLQRGSEYCPSRVIDTNHLRILRRSVHTTGVRLRIRIIGNEFSPSTLTYSFQLVFIYSSLYR
jgi:hypothetical protein